MQTKRLTLLFMATILHTVSMAQIIEIPYKEQIEQWHTKRITNLITRFIASAEEFLTVRYNREIK